MPPLRISWRKRKSSSARAIISTMALPMPSTSNLACVMLGEPFAKDTRTIGTDPPPATVGLHWYHAHLLRRRGPTWQGTVETERRPMAFKERVFSGVQPTGNLHLGNY